MEHPEAALVRLDDSDHVLDVDLIRVEIPPSQNPAFVYLSGLAPNSKRAMRAALNRVAGELSGWAGQGRDRRPRVPFEEIPWEQLRFQHVAALRSRLAEHHSPSAANQSLVAVREVMKAAWKLDLVDGDDYRKLIEVKSVKGERLRRGRALSTGEFYALVSACVDGSQIGQRDAALLAVLYAGGLRRAEAVGLDLASWIPDTGELRFLGKGNKERVVFIGDGAALALGDWIAIRCLSRSTGRSCGTGCRRRRSSAFAIVAPRKHACLRSLPTICGDRVRPISSMAERISRRFSDTSAILRR